MTDQPATTVAERVARGARLLDERMPGWERRVRIGDLAMSKGCACILGQLFGSFYQGQDDLDFIVDDSVAHGFERGSELEYTQLGKAWKSEIRKRRAAAATAEHQAGTQGEAG